MRIGAFARLGAAVATASVLAAAPALSYAPPEAPDSPAVEAPLLDAPTPDDAIELRPTTGRKGGLPPRAVPDDEPDPAALENFEEDGGPVVDVPFTGRATLADIRYGDAELPAPVAERRRRLIEAAKSGDIEALRGVFADQPLPPVVSAMEPPDDVIEFLRNQSGDPAGREILAIMIELLEAGYVKVGEGSEETYVWPYFAEVPLTELKPEHYVELYRVLTAVDVEDLMREGGYGFFRVGISPEGRLRYFSASEVE